MKTLIVLLLAVSLCGGGWMLTEGKDYTGQDLKNKEFINADLRKAAFDCADLHYAKFYNALAEKATFVGAQLQYANFRKANLSGADFTDARLEGATFTDAKAWDTKFNNCVIFLARAKPTDWGAIREVRNVDGAADIIAAYDDATSGSLSFRRSEMRNCAIYGNAEGVDFLQADLRGADLSEVVNLEKANLRGAKYDEETRWTINPDEKGAVFVHSERPPVPPPHKLAGKWIILKGIDDAKDHGVLYIWRDGLFEWDPNLSSDNPKVFAGEWNPQASSEGIILLKLDKSDETWTAELTMHQGKPELVLKSSTGQKQLAVAD